MSRLRLLGFGILGLALAVSVGISGDTKKDKDKEDKLPPGWADVVERATGEGDLDHG
jgi:hypothetical protein